MQNDKKKDRSYILSEFELNKKRKYVNTVLWKCISRPQYPKNCGLNSVTTCFNYLFSKLGHGELNIISQEESLALMGYGD